jgi:hypothetical protein
MRSLLSVGVRIVSSLALLHLAEQSLEILQPPEQSVVIAQKAHIEGVAFCCKDRSNVSLVLGATGRSVDERLQLEPDERLSIDNWNTEPRAA